MKLQCYLLSCNSRLNQIESARGRGNSFISTVKLCAISGGTRQVMKILNIVSCRIFRSKKIRKTNFLDDYASVQQRFAVMILPCYRACILQILKQRSASLLLHDGLPNSKETRLSLSRPILY